MADVSGIFGILLALGLVFPGLLTAWWLLFPATVERARVRLDRSPWPCFWLGGVLTAGLVIPIVVLLALPLGPAKLAGWTLIFASLGIASLGAAGLAAKMAGQIERVSGPTTSKLSAFVRAAVALELAAAFPLIGWVIVIPLATVTSLGATAFALMRWSPTRAAEPTPAAPVAPSTIA